MSSACTADFDSLKAIYNDCLKVKRKTEIELHRVTEEARVAHEALQAACEHQWDKDPRMYQTRSSYTCGLCGKDR